VPRIKRAWHAMRWRERRANPKYQTRPGFDTYGAGSADSTGLFSMPINRAVHEASPPAVGPGELRLSHSGTTSVVHHSKFGSQCLSWVRAQTRSFDDLFSVSGLPPGSGPQHVLTACRRSAQKATYAAQQMQLFDQLVGAQQERFRDFQAERPSGGQVDDKIELGRLLDRQNRPPWRPAKSCRRSLRRDGTDHPGCSRRRILGYPLRRILEKASPLASRALAAKMARPK
jgi:hypothetical protein